MRIKTKTSCDFIKLTEEDEYSIKNAKEMNMLYKDPVSLLHEKGDNQQHSL